MKLHIRNSGKKYRKVLGITWLRKKLLKISGLICLIVQEEKTG
jgi:hypothetical protein